jgi:hypothetical protein
MQLRQIGVLAALAVVLTGFVLAGPAAAKPGSPQAMTATITNSQSYNWAGYAATSSAGQTTQSAGAWTEPSVKCGTATTYAAFWIGIDGYGSSTVEQTGTLATCSGGKASYVAWWEMYPLNAMQTISTMTVKAGDKISASATYSSGSFTLTITDGTQSFTKTATQTASRASAECVAERPALSSGGSVTLSHLANFGTMTFSSCTATIGGTSAAIGTFANVHRINMVSQLGGHATLAATGTLGTNQSTFSIVWKRSN